MDDYGGCYLGEISQFSLFKFITETRHIQTQTHLYVDSKIIKLVETGSKMVITGG